MPIDYGTMVNTCSETKDVHTPECDGKCAKRHLTNTEVDLNNEREAWNIRGMSDKGIPLGMLAVGMQIPGIPVELFELEIKFQALFNTITEAGLVTEEQINEQYQSILLKRLRAMRERFDQERMAEKLLVPEHKILGPNGRPLH